MNISIIGGGLVGALAARILAQKGHNIELYELRQDPRQNTCIARGRSINLALSTRGRAALAKAGVENLVISHALALKGRMVHRLNEPIKTFIYDPQDHECIWSINRGLLNSLLLSEAEKHENVKVHFNTSLMSADLENGSFKIRDNFQCIEYERHADMIIGADGAHSKVRNSIVNSGHTNFEQSYIEHGYIELCIPSDKNGKHLLPCDYLHVWPRNLFMLIALPNQDGTFTATLFMPFDLFGKLDTREEVVKFFEQNFPDPFSLIGTELLVKDFLNSKPSSLISIKCKPFNAGRGVIIGDAAHAMVPFYGQGMNAGFEDILYLEEALSEMNCVNSPDYSSVQKSLSYFSERRCMDVQAMNDLAMYNYIEMRLLVNKPTFYLRVGFDTILHKLFHDHWIPLYKSVCFTRIPYKTCLENRKWQDQVISSTKNYITASFFILVGAIILLLFK